MNPDEAAVSQFTWKGNTAAVTELMAATRQATTAAGFKARE